MPTTITCPTCRATLQCPDEAVGRRVRCPQCRTSLAVQEAGAVAPHTLPTASPLPWPPPAPSTGPGPSPAAPSDATPPPWPPLPPSTGPETFSSKPDMPQTPSQTPQLPTEGLFQSASLGIPTAAGRSQAKHIGMQPHRAGHVLALGILGILLCTPLGPFAWSMASTDLHAMRQGRMDTTFKGVTLAGYVLGIIGTVILILQVVLMCLYLGTILSIISAALRWGRG